MWLLKLGRSVVTNTNKSIVSIVILNLCITVPLALFLNIWFDEACSLYTTSKDIGYAMHQALNWELQAPLYFILLNLWRNFNSSIFFARLFSILCITATLLIIPKISQRFFEKINPSWLTLIIALNPITIQFAVEIRCYALVILLSALLILFFYDGFLDEIRCKRAQLLYALFSILSLYTQYYVGFLLVSNAIVLLILKRWKPFYRYILSMVIVGLFFSPMILVVPNQFSVHATYLQSSNSLHYTLKMIIERIEEYIVVAPWLPFEGGSRWIRHSIVLSLFLLYLWKNFKKYDYFLSKRNITILTIVVVLALLFMSTLKVLNEAFLERRHTIVLFVPSILLIWSAILIVPKKNVVSIFTAVMICLYGIALYITYKPMAKNGDYIRVAEYIKCNEKPGQRILIYPPEQVFPFRFHYSGLNEQVAIPRSINLKFVEITNPVINSEQEILDALCEGRGDYQYSWLITDSRRKNLGLNTNVDILEGFINRYFTVESSKTFYGKQVVKFLKKKSDFQFYCK